MSIFDIDFLREHWLALWQQACGIWGTGGWAMPAIALNALVMFALGIHIHLKLREKGYNSVPEKTWRHWIDNPDKRKGHIGEILDFVTGGKTLKDLSLFFEELRTNELLSFQRELRFMKISIGTAPLLGLLGTVTGMLTTFGALSSGSGGDKTMAMVAAGISEALVTTQTGLVIALPGLFLQYQLTHKHDVCKSFLAHLESVCTQNFYKKICNRGNAVLQPAKVTQRNSEVSHGSLS